MNKTKIEWLRDADGNTGYSINPIRGRCLHDCPYCYAKKLYTRFKWNPKVLLDLSVFNGLEKVKAGSKVFVCSTHDFFGAWISRAWQDEILQQIRIFPNLIFILLTKAPQNAWGIWYPNNVWLGVSVEDQDNIWRLETLLQPEIRTRHKFVSFEPMQGEIDCNFVDYTTGHRIGWAIVGQETGNRKEKVIVKPEWIERLMAQHADTPFFLKNNLKPIWGDKKLRQEFPKGW